MRFVVDQCVPAEVARWIAGRGHQAWTASEAGLADAKDEDLLVYADDKRALLVTTNRDCAQLARRNPTASVVWLAVREIDARDAMERALDWLEISKLPTSRVLRVSKTAELKVLSPERSN